MLNTVYRAACCLTYCAQPVESNRVGISVDWYNEISE